MLLVASLAYKNDAKTWKMIENLAYGYPSERTQLMFSNKYQYDMGLGGFQESLHPRALDESSLSIGRVNSTPARSG